MYLISYLRAVLLGPVAALVFLAGTALGGTTLTGPAGDLREIRIITPQWEGQTNEDGSGLFFEIIRSVYEPEGIQMVFSFAPWKRCISTVRAGSQDAMLCVWQGHARKNRQLTPKLPLYIEHTAAVVKKASGIVWKGIHSLDYRRAVWMRGYNYQQSPRMEGIQLSDWHEVDAHDEAWHQLNLDRFDAYIDALIDIRSYLDSGRAEAGLYQIHLLWKQKAYAAFSDSQRSQQLIRIYNKRAAAMVDSGEMADIYRHWGQPFDLEDWRD